MATLDDKLLGEKTQYYCSSSSGSEGEEEEDSAGTGPADGPQGVGPNVSCQGPASNTGPKGVLADWRRYKQLEAEGREEARRERERLHRSLAFTCQSYGDEQRDREHQLRERIANKLTLKDDADDGDDADDADDAAFLSEYRERRMAELRRRLSSGPRYGAVTELPGGEALLRAVDESPPRTPVLVHVYDGAVPACAALDGCLRCLAPRYPSARVCRVRAAAVAGLSAAFASRALPALLVYRGGELVGNFVRLSDQLGDDFFADDLESFLGEHGLLPERCADVDGRGSDGSACRRSVVAAAAAVATASGDDSDLDID